MALVLADRVRETTTVTGTGTATLLGAVSGYQSFSAVGNANTTYYVIANQSATEWEVGIGTYTASGTTLSRDTVLSSSNSGSLVNFSAGTKDVFVDYPAGKAVYEDAAGNVDGYPITGGTINNTVIGGTTPAAGTFTTLTAQNETLKGTGQNLILQSQTFNNASWTKNNASITTAATTAPDSTNTGQKLVEDSATSLHYISQAPVIIGSTITVSVYAKQSERTRLLIRENSNTGAYSVFDVSTGSVITNSGISTGSIVSVGNGWYRCSITATFTASGSTNFGIFLMPNAGTLFADATYAGNGTSGLFIWGAQLEFGSTANTYIPTTTTAVYGTPTLSFSGVASIGLQSDGSLYETSAGTGNVRFYTNNIGQEQARVSHAASAVNFVQLTGAATAGQPTISAQGSDANVGIIVQSKGNAQATLQSASGNALLATDGGLTAIRALPRGASGDTWLDVQRNVGAVVLSAASGVSNGNLVLQPKGTGALQAQQTDSTATGGNARGANAVDWQTSRSGASQVASAQLSVIGGGTANTVTGPIAGILSGGFNTVSAQYAVVAGGAANAVTQYASGILAGQSNQALGYFNLIGGGFTNSATSGSAVTTQSGTMNATTAVTLSGSNANIKVGQLITGTSITSFTYVAAISGTSLTLSQAASGSSTSTLSFFTPHGVVVGGGNNQATGSYSFIGGGGDAGTAANRNVASGAWSVVVGGTKNTASGSGAFVGGGGTNGSVVLPNSATADGSVVVGGFNNTASGFGATVSGGFNNVSNGGYSNCFGGSYGSARGINSNNVFSSSGPIAGLLGASQAALLILGVQTTDATATVLRSDTSAASTNNQVILPNNSAYYFKGSVIANVTGGGNTKAWAIEGAIKRGANAASTALVGTPTVTSGYADAGASTWAITATADTTNGGLAITFTGQASTTIRCVAKLETTEVTF